MLKFRLITVLFILVAILIVASGLHFIAWILLMLSYIAAMIYGSANIRSGFFVASDSQGDLTSKKVAITFDDGPHPENTPRILDLLKDSGKSVAFFCIGEKIEKYPELAARIHREGHLLCNHSFSHSSRFPLKPVRVIRKELTDTRKLIEDLTGKPNQYFRPPYGVTNPLIHWALKGLNFQVIGWSIRSFDLAGHPAEKTIKRILSKLSGGDIILLHDTSPQALPILSGLLENLSHPGREIVRLDELLKEKTQGGLA